MSNLLAPSLPMDDDTLIMDLSGSQWYIAHQVPKLDTTAAEVQTGQHLRRNSLNILEIVMSGLVQIAPASSLILVTALMAGLAGASVPLVLILAMLGVAATGNALAQFSRMWPSAGSFVTFISRAIDPRVGTVVAVSALVGYIVAFAGIYLFVGSFILTEVFKADSARDGSALLTAVVYGGLIVIPVILGVRIGIRLAIAMYLIEIAIVLVISLAILVQGGDNGLSTEPFTFGDAGTKGVALAFALAVLAFVGFEAPAPLAEESENPRRNVPLAIMVGILVSGLIYLIGSYASIEAFPNAAAYAEDATPFTTAADRFISPLSSLITLLFLTSVSASFMVANTETSRVIFNGAREGLWHTLLARVHNRFGTPWLAVIAFVAPSLAIAAVAIVMTDAATAAGFLSTWGTLGIILMYAMTNVALIVLWFRERAAGTTRHAMTWLAVPLVGVAVMAIPYWSSFQPDQAPPFDKLPWYFAGLLAIGVLYTTVLQLRKPDVARNAGAIVMGETTPHAPVHPDPARARSAAGPP
ncbi:MAG: APC family permease [Thermoleophilaceae bacterium]